MRITKVGAECEQQRWAKHVSGESLRAYSAVFAIIWHALRREPKRRPGQSLAVPVRAAKQLARVARLARLARLARAWSERGVCVE